MGMCPAQDTHEYRTSCCGELVGWATYDGQQVRCPSCSVVTEIVLWCSVCNGLARNVDMLIRVGIAKVLDPNRDRGKIESTS